MTAQAAIATSGAPVLTPRQKSLAFFTVTIAVVLEVADSTIVNTALPAIRDALRASSAAMEWIVAGYLLSLGSLLLLGGRLGDAFGYRRIFLAGVSAFVLGSALCGMARSPEELVLARVVQGAAAAIMAPQSMAIIQHLYSPLERVSRLAWFGLILGSAAIVGPILGGMLIALNLFGLGWRLIFLVNLPIGLLALAMAWRTLPPARSATALRVDGLGGVIFAAGFGAILLALIQGPELNWPIWCLLSLVAGAAAVWGGWRRAVTRSRSGKPAIIAPELFGLATFRWGIAAALAHSSAFVGFLLIFSVSLQQGAGLTPLATGLIHVPFGLGVMAGVGFLVPRLLPRWGRRLPIGGSVVAVAGILPVLGLIHSGRGLGLVLVLPLALAGVGFGALSGPLGPIVVAEVDRDHAGAASATLRTAQQLGGALGIAMVGGAYFALAGSGATPFLNGLIPGGAVIACLLLGATSCLARQPEDIFARKRG